MLMLVAVLVLGVVIYVAWLTVRRAREGREARRAVEALIAAAREEFERAHADEDPDDDKPLASA